MSLATRTSDLATRIATEIKKVRTERATPGAGYYFVGNIATNAGADTRVGLATTAFVDDAAVYGLAGGTVTVKKAGIYHVSCTLLSTGAAGNRLVIVRQSSTPTIAIGLYTAGGELRSVGSRTVRCAAGDTFELSLNAANGASFSGGSALDTGLTFVRVGD